MPVTWWGVVVILVVRAVWVFELVIALLAMPLVAAVQALG